MIRAFVDSATVGAVVLERLCRGFFDFFSLMLEVRSGPVCVIEASVLLTFLLDNNLSIFFHDVRLYLFETNWANAESFPENFLFLQVKAPKINAIGINIIVLVTNLSCFFTTSILSAFLRRDTPETTRIMSQMIIGIKYA